MSEKEKQILGTFAREVPGLSEKDKNILIVYGQGIAEGKRLAMKEMEEKRMLEQQVVV